MKIGYLTLSLWLIQMPFKIFAFCWLIAMIGGSAVDIWSLSWPITEARIVESAISKEHCNTNNKRKNDDPGQDVFFIKYKFVVQDVVRIGTRVTLVSSCFDDGSDPKFASKYLIGTRVPVYYAPGSILRMEYLEPSTDWSAVVSPIFFTLLICFFGFYPFYKWSESAEKQN
jgi:hypothetical protein